MKPRISIFGLPKNSSGKLKILVYKNPTGSNLGEQIFSCENDDSGFISEFIHSEIDYGNKISFQIMSSGIVNFFTKIDYMGTDISLVPHFQKEKNTSDKDVSKDWDLDLWKNWKPDETHQQGLELEKKHIMSRKISVAPIWESYYAESYIDYLEKFHKLWIGLNAFASHFSGETRDKNKILALVNSDLRNEFNSAINKVSNLASAEKWRTLQTATGSNMTSNIVRDEINTSCSSFQFMSLTKSAKSIFEGVEEEMNGMIFLDKDVGKDIFQHIFAEYHRYMASEEGVVQVWNLADAFTQPNSPQSVIRKGKLVFHNPYLNNDPGRLFRLSDYFGSTYGSSPYSGGSTQKLRDWEIVDPFFYKYLHLLYKFRCAYFHGDLPPNNQNNNLARAAYESLYEIFPAIIQ